MHRYCLAVLTLALMAGLPPAPATAAEIETRITPEMAEMGCTLRLSGPIEADDAARLRAALAVAPPPPHDDPKADLSVFLRHFAPAVDFGHLFFTHRLCLNSPGGPSDAADLLVEALATGAVRAAGGVPTAVARGDACAGTCVRVFLAGRFAFLPSHPDYDGPAAANALLNPEGVLDLAGMFEPGPEAVRQAARLLGRANGGWLNVTPRLLHGAMLGVDRPVHPLRTVGDAVELGIEVEPNPLHLGLSPGTDAELAANLCAHAARLAPAQVALAPRGDGLWHDSFTDRVFECVPGDMVPEGIRSFLDYPLDPDQPRPRLATTCDLRASFRLPPPCHTFSCEFSLDVALPCLALYPPDTPLPALAVPLAGR
jgi:hypothetical protein